MSLRSTFDVIIGNQEAIAGPQTTGSQSTVWTRDAFSTNAGAWDGFSIALENQVQQPLNLCLPLKTPAQATALGQFLIDHAEGFRQGVLGLRYVHFARFLIAPDGSHLWVITTFDGDFESYLMDFVATMAPLFTGVMQYIAGAPRLPVEDYPIEFMQFVRDNNLKAGVISAYPQLTVLEIMRNSGVRGNNLAHPPKPDLSAPGPATSASPDPLDLDDIQGNILRGYRFPDVRYYMLQVADPAGGQALLATLLQGTNTIPAVETAAEWTTKPAACLNVFVTHDGLLALGVPAPIAATFPDAFVAGSAQRSIDSASDGGPWGAIGIGDVGDSAPDRWIVGGTKNEPTHIVISVFTDESASPQGDSIGAALGAVCAANGIKQLECIAGHSFDDGVVHFGFRDGLSQPQIAGRPGDRTADMQPDAMTGDFLLGKNYTNTYRGNFIGDVPPVLGDNGSYMALRILEQDCKAFEDFINRTGDRFDMDPELIAAKLVGRWRNGVPVAVSPEDDRADIAADSINQFDHAATLDHPANFDDVDGIRCPFGSHMRRMNPRGGAVTGLQHNRRIVRRGIAFGPKFDPAQPDDGVPRGLLGAFICGDLASQFEFLQKVWSNMDIAAPKLGGSRDPIIGYQTPEGGRFEIPSGDSRGVLTATDLPRLVTTRGSLYLFIPGISGLKALAAGTW